MQQWFPGWQFFSFSNRNILQNCKKWEWGCCFFNVYYSKTPLCFCPACLYASQISPAELCVTPLCLPTWLQKGLFRFLPDWVTHNGRLEKLRALTAALPSKALVACWETSWKVYKRSLTSSKKDKVKKKKKTNFQEQSAWCRNHLMEAHAASQTWTLHLFAPAICERW